MKFDCKGFCFLFLSCLLFFSCKEPTAKMEPAPPLVAGLTGNFYRLECSKTEFDKLTQPSSGGSDPRGNVVFKYYILNGKFTLNGWEIQGRSGTNFAFDSLPSVYFMPTSIQSDETYGDKTYLGDFLLRKSNVVNIQQLLVSRGHNFVIFRPKLISPGNLIWEVGTSVDGALNSKDSFDPVLNAYLDPIPPKRYDR